MESIQKGEDDSMEDTTSNFIEGVDVATGVQSIVEEYSAILSDLARLTAELPKRLHLIGLEASVSATHMATAASTNNAADVHGPVPSNDKAPSTLETRPLSRDVREDTEPEPPVDEAPSKSERRSVSLEVQVQKESVDKSSSARPLTEFEKSLRAAFEKTDMHAEPREIERLLHIMKSFIGHVRARHPEHAKHHLNRYCQSIKASHFDVIVGFLIIANSLTIMIRLNYEGYLSNVFLGIEPEGAWPNAEIYFDILEHVFNGIFVVEAFLRILLFGWRVMKEAPVILDVILVLSSSLQLYVLAPMEVDGMNFSFLRMLRFIKFVRLLRLVRVLNLFAPLRILVKTVIASMSALMWSMVLLMFIIVIGGLLLCELLTNFIRDPERSIVTRIWVNKHYGTSFKAMYTLFEVTLAGCWPTYFRPLIDEVSGLYVVFAIVYISVVVFAIIRIITAIFLRETLMVANNDDEMMVHEKLKQKALYAKKLESIFVAVDTSGDGKLSVNEFKDIINHNFVKAFMQTLEMEVHDAMALFEILDDGDGMITYEEFTKGVLRLKGQARTMDIVEIMVAVDRLSRTVEILQEKVNRFPSRFGLPVKLTGVTPRSSSRRPLCASSTLSAI